MLIFAYNQKRGILIGDRPQNLYADLADIQPACPIPLVGLCCSSSTIPGYAEGDETYSHPTRHDMPKMSTALALGHWEVTHTDLLALVRTNPFEAPETLLHIAKRIGLSQFLEPPIDSLSTFGHYIGDEYHRNYKYEEFVQDTDNMLATGASLSVGDITEAKPEEAMKDPEYYFKELEKASIINRSIRSGKQLTLKWYGIHK